MFICLDQRTGTGCGAENTDTAKYCHKCGKPLRFALQILDPGTLLHHYHVLNVIGHGGFGAVYEAEVIQRPHIHVALKESLDPESITGFRDEFSLLQQLRHDHLPRYYEMFEADDNGYLVMEMIPGQSLADVLSLQNGPLYEAQVLGYALQLCDVLHYLHTLEPSLIHRDIKPANVRITPAGLVKLVDFGLLKQGDGATRSSRRGLTPDYAPPEQWGMDNQHTDQRSDVYSLGATLYHLLTGQRPPSAANRLARSTDPLLAPQQYNPRLSAHVTGAIVRAMALRREARFGSMVEFKLALLGMASPVPVIDAVPTITQLSSPDQPDQSRINPPVKARQANGDTQYPFTGTSAHAASKSDTPSDELKTLMKRKRARARLLKPLEMRAVTLWRTLSEHPDVVASLAWNPTGKILTSGCNDKEIRLWPLDTSKPRSPSYHHNSVALSLAWHPAGNRLASGSLDGSVVVWSLDSQKPTYTLSGHQARVTSVAWHPEGTMLASASFDQEVRLWSVAAKPSSQILRGPKTGIYSITWSPDGNYLASGSGDESVYIWDVCNQDQIVALDGHIGFVKSVAWSPNGKLLATCSDNTVQIWRVADYSIQHVLRGHSYGINCLAWNPDSQTIASGGIDSTVRIWRVKDGKLLFTLKDHTDHVTSLAWSPDGQTLASASSDRKVHLWRIEYR